MLLMTPKTHWLWAVSEIHSDRTFLVFFKLYSDNFYNNVRTAANEYRGEHCYVMSKEDLLKASPLELISIFLSQQIHFTFNEWFYEFLTWHRSSAGRAGSRSSNVWQKIQCCQWWMNPKLISNYSENENLMAWDTVISACTQPAL